MNQEIKDMEGNVIAQLTRPDRAETLSEKVFENEWFRVKLQYALSMSSSIGWCRCDGPTVKNPVELLIGSTTNSSYLVTWTAFHWTPETISIKKMKDGVEISGTQKMPFCNRECDPEFSHNSLKMRFRDWTPIIEVNFDPEIMHSPVWFCNPAPVGGSLKASAWLYNGKDLTPYEITKNRTPPVDVASGMTGVIMERGGGSKATMGVQADIEYSESPFSYGLSLVFDLGFGFWIPPREDTRWWNEICGRKVTYYLLYNPLEASTDELIRGYNDVLKIKEEPLFCLPGVILPKTCIYKSRPYVRRE